MELPAAGALLISSLVFLSLSAISDASPPVLPRVSVSGRLVGEENLAPLATGLLKFSPVVSESIAPYSEAKFPLVLAAKRTKRPDILNKFRPYRGGWDITNKHYWASVGFTGAAGFILAFLWFISFGVALVAHHCCRLVINIKDKSSYHSHRIFLILLLVFTCAASTGCILLSVGQDEFHGEVLSTLTFVVNQSDFTVQILRNVTEYLLLAKTINVDQVILPSDVQRKIEKLNADLDAAATTLSDKTTENSGKIKQVFGNVRRALIVNAAVMLLLALLGFLLSFHRHQHAIYIFVVSGWILVAVTFTVCGVFVILNNSISDACTAMDEWSHNPQAQTALTNILPCVDERTSNRTLCQSKEVILQLVNVVNTAIETIANSDAPAQDNSFYYNQTGPMMPSLCSPYDMKMRDRQCEPQEVSFINASSVWQNYTCTILASGSCASIGRVTPDIYKQLVAAVNASYALSHYTPLLLNLQDCNFVRETFDTITSQYCPHLEHNLRMVNAGLAMISAGVMLCLILWILYANRPKREEVFAKLSEVKISTDGKIPMRSAELSSQ